MRFFFRRSSEGATAELTLPLEESPKDHPGSPEQSLKPDTSFAPPRELVNANELPSAASALAELFADEPASDVGVIEKPPPVSLPADSANVDNFFASVQPISAPPETLTSVKAAPVKPAPAAAKGTAKEKARQASQPAPPTSSGELCAEDAATVLAAASEEITAEDKAADPSNQPKNASSKDSHAPVLPGALPSSNWALEEILAAHREWIESKGMSGKKADLANAQLDAIELIGVNLQHADLHYADLKSTDLLLADLRDACLVRADMEEACLVGANLEGANLEGASLETALGLVPRQLAGTNLREASLPSQIAQFPAVVVFRTASQAALRFFTALMTLSVLSALAIWRTKDIQLVTDSAILPFLHSAKAAAAMPSAEIFLIAPIVLFLLYLAFLAQAQKIWAAVLELPAIFPDGRMLGEKESGIVVGLLRAQFRWMNQDAPSTRWLEKTVSLLLAYWMAPILLFLFWARYLTVQEIHGTVLHEALACAAAGIALHATFKVGRPPEKWALERTFTSRVAEKLHQARPPVFAGVLLVLATFISFGTIAGVPHDRSRAPQYGTGNIRRWAPTALWSVGYDPYADLTEAALSVAPRGWNGSDEQVASVRGIHLNNPRFRYVQAYGAFAANAHLWHADFRGAYLSDSDFRAADLTQSNLQYAIMDGVHMNRANLDRAILESAHLARADFREANLSYANLANSFLMDARFDGASLYDASLANTNLIRATFSRADLRNAHLGGANLEHASFQQAYLWSANVQGADLKGAELGGAILIGANFHGASLEGAHFAQTVLNETDLSGASLDGADMRGAFGLTATQICSARSHAGALFDDALQTQITAQCPAAH